LASLPSLDVLRSKLIAVISAPATKLAILLKEPAARVARVLSAKNG
jgi:large subunit ribosomal protein L10